MENSEFIKEKLNSKARLYEKLAATSMIIYFAGLMLSYFLKFSWWLVGGLFIILGLFFFVLSALEKYIMYKWKKRGFG